MTGAEFQAIKPSPCVSVHLADTLYIHTRIGGRSFWIAPNGENYTRPQLAALADGKDYAGRKVRESRNIIIWT